MTQFIMIPKLNICVPVALMHVPRFMATLCDIHGLKRDSQMDKIEKVFWGKNDHFYKARYDFCLIRPSDGVEIVATWVDLEDTEYEILNRTYGVIDLEDRWNW